MANIIAIITAVVLAAAAFLAHKNHAALESEIEDRMIQEGYLRENQKTLASLRAERDETIGTRKETRTTITEKREEEEAQIAKNESLENQIEEKSAERDRNAQRISEIEEQTKELGEVSEIAGNIRSLQNRIQDFQDEKDSKEAVLSNLVSEKNSTVSTIDRYASQNSAVSNRRSYFEGASIGAVYGNWGFVTLTAGNSAGVVGGSKLDVVRGGETIAQLRVRSVESTRASADLIPDSLAEDTTLMVGDRVVPANE